MDITHGQETIHVSWGTASTKNKENVFFSPCTFLLFFQNNYSRFWQEKNLFIQSIYLKCTLWLFWVHSNNLPHSNTCAMQAQFGGEKNHDSLLNLPSLYTYMFPRSQCLGMCSWNVKLYQRIETLPCYQEAKISELFANKAIENFRQFSFVQFFYLLHQRTLLTISSFYCSLQPEIRFLRGSWLNFISLV